MTPERWQRVNELFNAALEKQGDARRVFLVNACGDDHELRREVEKLLNGDEAAGRDGFLDNNPLNLKDQLPSTCDMTGRTLGAYVIKKRIGSGGMGNVYLAARTAGFKQRVAIKLLKRGMDSDEIVKRFRREIRVLAALGAHPNIARLIDAGTNEDGRPYFVMEYVEGEEIDLYCDRNRLSLNERLKVFQAVCNAVHFAHQHTVIHRDIKPSNVLVMRDGTPKLIDFGIAKLTAPELSGETAVQTRTECRAMTPEYASPEQVRGEPITTSTDVYSLGVVLYQLLTGRRPYELSGRTAKSLQNLVSESKIDKPSTVVKLAIEVKRKGKATTLTPEEVSSARKATVPALRSSLRGDLDNIAMMALRREPKDRYASAGQLAVDIQRYLDDQPVTARPLSRRQKCVRAAKNYPVVTALAAAVLVGSWFGLAHLSRLSRELVRSTALEAAAQQTGILYEGHRYYTKVLGEIKEKTPTAAMELKPPATFTIELFEFLNESDITLGTTARMRSDYPFKTRRRREPLDQFERAAIRYFESDKVERDAYYRFEQFGDGPALRYAIAMRMEQSCCDCHNHHPDSTKTDWRPGQVRGVLEVIRPLKNDTDRMTSGLWKSLAWIGLVVGGVFTVTSAGIALLRR